MPTVTVRICLNQDDDEHASNGTTVRIIAQWLDNGITTGTDVHDTIHTMHTNANNTRGIW